MGDFAARVRWLHEGGAAIFTTLLEAGKRPGGTSQQDALTLLVTQLAGPTFIGSAHSLPPTFTHTPEEAGELLVDLSSPLDEPVQCRCGRYVEQPTQLTDTCGVCVDRADVRVTGGAS